MKFMNKNTTPQNAVQEFTKEELENAMRVITAMQNENSKITVKVTDEAKNSKPVIGNSYHKGKDIEETLTYKTVVMITQSDGLKLEAYAKELNKSRAAVVRTAIIEYLDNHAA